MNSPPSLLRSARALARLSLLAAAALGSGAQLTADPAPQQEDGFEVTNHSIPVNGPTTALAQRAEEHLAAGRWDLGLGDLQELLENHAGELLGRTRPMGGDYDVFPGVTVWVRELLNSLPDEAQQIYRERHGERALQAFERARARRDLTGLTELAARWPLTRAASLSWWTIGDIEMERGNYEPARAAWVRALRADPELAVLGIGASELENPALLEQVLSSLEEEGRALPPGVRLRFEDSARRSPGDDGLAHARPRASELELPGPGEGARGTPGQEASTWAAPFSLPEHPFAGSVPIHLHAARAADAVLVSTSLELFCINAYAGTLRWRSGEPDGWEKLHGSDRKKFFEGRDKFDALIAPTASESVAVAALQVPVTQNENANFNQIKITVIIPDRRLFAYDLESGDPLWDHAPPLDWDGESGEFARRMRIAGPPVIANSRVLVTTYRMQGRIDCHVASYDLATGELAWSTPVISGQLELNMFNRHQWEYSAPPLCIAGDRVICLTQLGTVAALDLFSGALLWETRYDQVPLPPRHSPSPTRRRATWKNTGPVVADGVVIATPTDSDDLLGLDLETGAMLWTMRQGECNQLAEGRGDGTDTNLLLGADEHRVYLGGRRLVALFSVAGLRFERPDQIGWQVNDSFFVQEKSAARPVLTADRIVVPSSSQRIEVERYTGRRMRQPVAWKGDLGGNLLLGDGMLFTLGSHQLNGYFEWDLLLARARAELDQTPTDVGAALRLAALLAERGHTDREAGRSLQARGWLDDAVQVLEPLMASDDPRGGAEVSSRMHHVLRSRARVLADLADGRAALESLRTARPLSPTRSDRRDVLLEEAELLRDLGRTPERLAVLDELRLSSADLSMGAELAPVTRGFEPGEEARVRALAYAGPGSPPWRLEPLLDREPVTPLAVRELAVGLWIALERADEYAREGDVAGELEELHEVLALWREQELADRDARRVADARIAGLIEREGRAAYATFEQNAAGLLERALEERDERSLSQVAELYPHSLASRRANDVLLDWALEDGNREEAFRIVLGELPAQFSPTRSTQRQATLLLRLAGALADAGNELYLAELLASLSRTHPELVSPLERHAGATLARLVPENDLAPVPTPQRTFTADCRERARFDGRHDALGAVPADPRSYLAGTDAGAGDEEVLLFARATNIPHTSSGREVSIVAFGSKSPEAPLWTDRLDAEVASPFWAQRAAFAPGVALIATKRSVIAYERDGVAGDGAHLDGVRGGGRRAARRRFEWTPRLGDVDAVFANAGVVLVQSTLPGRLSRLYGIDLATGAELWHADFEPDERHRRPVCGAGRAVLLPPDRHGKAIVIDLFTGRRALELETPPVGHEGAAGSWIEGDRLIVPWFDEDRFPDRNQILGIDLESGNRLWQVPIGEISSGAPVLEAILQSENNSLLILRTTERDAKGRHLSLFDLRTTLGITGSIDDFEPDTAPLGLPRGQRVVTDAPLLFLRSSSPVERDVRLHTRQLLYGTVRWIQQLPLERDQLDSLTPPLPAVGASTVGVVLSKKSANYSFHANLYLFDRYSGQRGETQILDGSLGRVNDITLHPLGDSLLIAGEDLLMVMR